MIGYLVSQQKRAVLNQPRLIIKDFIGTGYIFSASGKRNRLTQASYVGIHLKVSLRRIAQSQDKCAVGRFNGWYCMVCTQNDDIEALVDTGVCKLGQIVKMGLWRRISTAWYDGGSRIVAPVDFEVINKRQVTIGGVNYDLYASLHSVSRNTQVLLAIAGRNRRIVVLRQHRSWNYQQKQGQNIGNTLQNIQRLRQFCTC